MAVNLMANRQDPNNEDKNNKIDLSLERPSGQSEQDNSKSKTEVSQPEVSTTQPIKVSAPKPVNNLDLNTEPEKKTIKITPPKPEGVAPEVPQDLNLTQDQTSEPKGTKIVIMIIVLLLVGAGGLLFLLNSESQFLKGSVNELPTSPSTQIVDDILSQEFGTPADTNTETTTVDSDSLSTNSTSTDSSTTSSQTDTTNSSSTNSTNTGTSTLEVENTNSTTENTTTTSNNETEALPVVESNQSTENNIQTEIMNSADENTTSNETTTQVNTTNNISDRDLISEYNLDTSSEVTNELIAQSNTNQSNDFNESANQTSNVQVTQPEVISSSEEIQGETGPGLWLSVIFASLISFYARRKQENI